MLKRGIGYTPENRKEAGIIPRLGVDENTVLTNRQNQRQRRTAMVHHPPPDRRGDAADDGQGRQWRNAHRHAFWRQSAKVVIGRWVYAASQILLLDEPTRGVDIEAKQQILPYCP